MRTPPPICDKCVCFGHVSEECPMTKSWVPKQTQVADSVEENPVEPGSVGSLEIVREVGGNENSDDQDK